MFGETPADSTGLLGTEIKRNELLVLVRLSESRLLLLGCHGQHLSDGFADNLAVYYKTHNSSRLNRETAQEQNAIRYV